MTLNIRQASWDDLDRYVSVPAVVTVTSVLRTELADGGLEGIRLHEQPVEEPYTKDYDLLNPPSTWREAIPNASWLLLLAEEPDAVLGAAAAYTDSTPVATLWDIRIRGERQRAGAGSALLEAVRGWAREAGREWLRAETQDTNVVANKFYCSRGGILGGIDSFFYGEPAVQYETALFWYFRL